MNWGEFNKIDREIKSDLEKLINIVEDINVELGELYKAAEEEEEK